MTTSAADLSSSTADRSDRIPRQVWIICTVAMAGAIMSNLDTTIVNVAWVITGYLLALAAVVPVTGWAARRVGAKRIFLLSLILFTLGSLLCGLATSDTELILFRVLQGAGGGMIMPLAQILMAEAAGPQRMGRVISLIGVPMTLFPMLGPALGGVIIQTLDWHWIFYVNLVVAAIVIPLAIKLLPADAGRKTDPLDFAGLGLMSTGLVAITYGLAEAGTYSSFTSAHVWVPGAAGLALVTAFAARALRIKNPLLDLRLYRKSHFAAASLVMFGLGASVFGAMILLPLYWQELRHFSVIKTGLLITPQGMGMIVATSLASKATQRYGGGRVALLGVLTVAIATIPLGFIGAQTPVATLCVELFIRGIGMAFSFTPAMTAAFAALDHSEVTHATPQLNVLNRVGGSLGTTILAVVLVDAGRHAHSPAAAAGAYGTAFWWSAGICLLGAIPCVVLKRAEDRARSIARETGAKNPDTIAIESGAVAEALA